MCVHSEAQYWADVCVSAGVCLGMQLAVCEFARNTLGWTGNNLSCYSNLQKKSFQASFLTFRSKTEREVLSDLC